MYSSDQRKAGRNCMHFSIMPNPQNRNACMEEGKQVFKDRIDAVKSQFAKSSARVIFTCRLYHFENYERIPQRKCNFNIT